MSRIVGRWRRLWAFATLASSPGGRARPAPLLRRLKAIPAFAGTSLDPPAQAIQAADGPGRERRGIEGGDRDRPTGGGERAVLKQVLFLPRLGEKPRPCFFSAASGGFPIAMRRSASGAPPGRPIRMGRSRQSLRAFFKGSVGHRC